MRGIGIEVEAAEVRNAHDNAPTGPGHAMQFFHDRNDVLKMLDDVLTHYPVELAIRERVGKVVEIPNHVRAVTWIDVECDCSDNLLPPGTYMESLETC